MYSFRISLNGGFDRRLTDVRNVVRSSRLLHSTRVGPPGVLVEPTYTKVYCPMRLISLIL